MAHWLGPNDARSFLTPSEIEERLRKTFRFVSAEDSAGMEVAEAKIRHLNRLGAVPPELVERIRREADGTRFVVADEPSDSASPSISFTVQTGKSLLVRLLGVHSPTDHDDAFALLARCATALGYSYSET